MKGNAVAPAAEPESAVETPESGIESGTREELIRQAAYRRYQARGASGSESDAEQDWLDAEAEVNQSFVEQGSPTNAASQRKREEIEPASPQA